MALVDKGGNLLIGHRRHRLWGGGTLPTRDDATAEQLGKDKAENLDNSKEKNNNMTTTADNADDGYKEFLAILNEPSVSPASDPRQP